MRILAVDPGEMRIGLALSDASGKVAFAHSIFEHRSRAEDAAHIAALAKEKDVVCIVVGEALDTEGRPTLQSRKAKRLAAAIREASGLEVRMWDESGSSQAADAALRAVSRRLAEGRALDDVAATVILQSYLDAQLAPDDQ